MSTVYFPENYLLGALAKPALRRIMTNAEMIELKIGDSIYEVGARQNFAYFPTTAIIAMFYVLENGISAEIAEIGNEGFVGMPILVGKSTAPNCAVVQRGGYAYRFSGRLLKLEFDRTGSFLRLLLRYSQALMTQITQNLICNLHHSIEQRLCRYLLQNLDRTANNTLVMTQQSIAIAMGVRRESVTEAAGNLQRAGVIRYSRGHIELVDRAGLEKMVCECYHVILSEFEILL